VTFPHTHTPIPLWNRANWAGPWVARGARGTKGATWALSIIINGRAHFAGDPLVSLSIIERRLMEIIHNPAGSQWRK